MNIKDDVAKETTAEEKCSICLDPLKESSAVTLPCTHVFHATCVAELRKFGIQQACPLCRIPLPPGPERALEEATRRFVVVSQLVERGRASWSTLPEWAQQEVNAVVAIWQTAANQGDTKAQYNLGAMYANGYGVALSDMEAKHW